MRVDLEENFNLSLSRTLLAWMDQGYFLKSGKTKLKYVGCYLYVESVHRIYGTVYTIYRYRRLARVDAKCEKIREKISGDFRVAIINYRYAENFSRLAI